MINVITTNCKRKKSYLINARLPDYSGDSRIMYKSIIQYNQLVSKLGQYTVTAPDLHVCDPAEFMFVLVHCALTVEIT